MSNERMSDLTMRAEPAHSTPPGFRFSGAARRWALALLCLLGMVWLSTGRALANPTGNPSTVLYVAPVPLGSDTAPSCDRQMIPGVDEAPNTYSYEFCTLARALELAEDGDILWLDGRESSGIYPGVEITKSVTLVGGFTTFPELVSSGNPTQEADGSSYSVLEGDDGEPTIVVKNITNTLEIEVRLERLQVQHAAETWGPGIFVRGPVSPTDYVTITAPITDVPIALTLAGVHVTQNQVGAGDDDPNGGALQIDPDVIAALTIEADHLGPAIFSENQAAAGGALWLTLPTTVLDMGECVFQENRSTQGDGGAIYMAGPAAFALSSCVFESNQAAGNGGSVYLADVDAVSLANVSFTGLRTLEDDEVAESSAGGDGGGFYMANGASLSLTQPCVFANHIATGDGGALYVAGVAAVSLSNCSFNTNRSAGGDGGGASLSAANLTLSAVSFVTNTAQGAGGGALITGTQSANLNGNIFTDNYAVGGGGALAVVDSTVTLDALAFTNHRTGGNGGALFASNSQVTSTAGIAMTGNRAAQSGGAVYLTSSSTLLGPTLNLQDNRATNGNGGALFAGQSSAVNITGAVNVANNFAQTGSGGGVYLGGSSNLTGGVAHFAYNRAGTHGGGLFGTNGMVQFTSAHFEHQEALAGRGGAVYFAEVGSLGVNSQLRVEYNKAHTDGGGFYGGITVTSGGATTVYSNTAQTGSGGGILLTGGGLTVASLTVEDNQAQVDSGGLGAAVANISVNGATVIHNNRALTGDGGGGRLGGSVVGNFLGPFTLTDNWARRSGGGLVVQAGDLTFSQVATATNNRALEQDGGAFYFISAGQATFQQLQASNNEAYRDGGAVYASSVALTIGNGSVITSNRALERDGGGLYVADEEVLFPGTVTITFNEARRNGGGVYGSGSDISLANASNISNNRASFPSGPGNGGGLYIVGGESVLDNVTVKFNTARDDGGGLFVGANGRVTARNGTDIDGNEVTDGRGGGIFVATGGIVQLDAMQLRNNTAPLDGGGLYLAVGEIHGQNNTQITGNRSVTGNGGGAAVITGTVALTNSVVNNNRAQLSGGGIYNRAGTVFGLQSQYNDNQADAGFGGGIGVIEGVRVELRAVSVSKNLAALGGGGIYAVALTTILADSTVTANNGGKGPGGGVFAQGDLARMHRNALDDNQTAGDGGGLALANVGEFNVGQNSIARNIVRRDVTVLSVVLEEDVILAATGEVVARAGEEVSRQEVSKGAGAGLHTISSSGIFTNNTFMRNDNQAGSGGGLFLRAGDINLTNNLVVQNRLAVTQVYGSGIYFAGTKAALYHTTVADNVNSNTDPDALGVGIFASRTTTDTSGNSIRAEITMFNNIVAGHDVGMLVMAGAQVGMTSTVWDNGESQWDGPGLFEPSVGNVLGDPLFVDRANGDYHIRRDSAAFDIGVPTAVAVDIDGTPRLRAFGVDAGAYEQFYPAGLHMRVTADPAFVNSGDTIEYRVDIVNHSGIALNGVTLNVTLPGQQTLVTSSCNNSTNCALGNLAPEQGATVTLVTTAAGTPPAQGFIEMLTTFTLNAANLGAESDRTETITTRLQRCRIVYAARDYATIQAAINAVDDTDDIPDIVRVSGYCGGPVRVDKTLRLEGGWNTSFTQLDFEQFPTTIDSAGLGRGIEIRNQIAPEIENFVIRGATASGRGGGVGGKDAGGGIYVRDAFPIVRNVRIISPRAVVGGGIYVHDLIEPTFINVTVEGASADVGAGIFAYKSSPKFENSTFRNNTAAGGGGAYFLQTTGASISGTTFANNRATGTARYIDLDFFNLRFTNGGGGGINMDEAQVSVSTSVFEGNSAKAGGAILADNSPGSVSGSVFHNNSASSDASSVPILILANTAGGGGAIYMQRSNMSLAFNRFTNNTASGRGGAVHIFNVDGDGSINGNFFGFNNASGGGSAIYAHLRPDKARFFVLPLLDIPDQLIPLILGLEAEPAAIRMDHNTFAHNQGGSTVLFYGEGRAFMVNNIVAFNSGTSIRAQVEILPFILLIAPIPFIGVLPIPYVVPYIPIISMDTTLWHPSSSTSGQVNQTASLTGNPHFKDDGYHIKRISAAFGAGKNVGGGVDLDGDTRPQGSFADIGADEYAPATRIRYVAPNGAGGAPCTNYLTPCGNLQVAIDAALDGDIIKLAGGTYQGGLATRDGQTQMGYITKTLTIQGGYYPLTTNNTVTEGRFTQHDWEVPFPDINPSILDAGGAGRVLYIFDPERVDQDGNPVEVRPIISGVQLRNGDAAGLRGPEANTHPAGGGIYIDRAEAVLNNVLISASRASYGGGLYILESDVAMDNVRLVGNEASGRGGGLYLDQSDEIQVRNLLIEDNVAPRGAGVYVYQSAAIFQSNQLRNNGGPTTLAGGGLYLDASDAVIEEHVIAGNRANQGGGVYVDQGDPQLLGNTVANNTAFAAAGSGKGGGFYFAGGGGQMENNTVEANQADDGGGIYLDISEFQIVGNVVRANIATRAGGGIYYFNTTGASVRENQIAANQAQGTGENDGGGGLYYESSNAASRGNLIEGNSAQDGGGAYLFSFSNAPLEENTITANRATRDGGGVYIKLSNAVLTKNAVLNNSTNLGNGGGIYVKLSGAQLNENRIEENQATLFGGGIYLDESGALLRQGTVENNQARDGGGLYIFRSNTASFDRLNVRLNRADNNGGGVYIFRSSVPFEGQKIEQNQAGVTGGGVYLFESNSVFSRNLVRDNRAGESGGGVALVNNSNAMLGSNAVIDNEASTSGSGIFVGGSSPTLIHTTVARNRGGDATGVAATSQTGVASTVTLINSIFAGQDLALRATPGNTITLEATLWDNSVQTRFTLGQGVILSGPPALNFEGDAAFEADGYHIQRTSKAIGVGVFTDISRDIDGQGRPQGGAPDLGADELPAECLAVVSTSPDVTYTEVQDAINAADPGAEVRIAGTCAGVRDQGGTLQLAYVNKNITLRGGYTPTNWTTSYPITQPTFLDALGDGRVIYVGQNVNPTIEDLNLLNGSAQGLGGGPSALDAGGILYVRNASPTLRRLTLTAGTAYYGGGLFLQNSQATVTDNEFDGHNGTKGGAVFLRNSTATLRNNIIRTSAAEDGGGVFLSFSQPLLEFNEIVQNSALAAGGGLFLESSPATLRANLVATNTAEAAGGIYVDGSTPQLIRNQFLDNEAQNGGGVYLQGTNGTVNGNRIQRNTAAIGAGVYVQGGQPNFYNNVVAQNQAQVEAAGVYVLSSSFAMRHNTLAANTGGDGVGLFITDLGVNPSQISFVNNILVDHTVGITLTAGNRIDLSYTLYHQNGLNFGGSGIVQQGSGNFNAPPQFVDAAGGDFHLGPGSPAVDAGTDAGVTDDFDGQARPADNGFDIGADEFVVMGLRITVQTIPDPIVAGRNVDFLIRAVNLGNVVLVATIVAELPDAVEPNGLFTFTASIPPGEAWTQTISALARADFVGSFVIKVRASTEEGLAEEVSVTALAERPDFAMQLTAVAVPNPAPRGGQLRYRLSLANEGNLALSPTVRAELSPLSSYDGPLEWDVAQLTPGSAWARNVDVIVASDAEGTIAAIFTATSAEGATSQVRLEVPVADPGLVIERFVEPNPPVAGRVVTYTIFATNTGNVDFTTTITNFMPVDASGRPLVAPGGPIVFEGVAIRAGETWIQQIVGVVEPGYSGPLNSSVVGETDTGLVVVYADDGINGVLPDIGPTIVAVRDGPWDDPNTWEPVRVPNPDDIALIPQGRVLTLDGRRLNPVRLTGLINQGDILVDCALNTPVVFEVSDILENSGRILGAHGTAPGQPGCGLEIDVGTLHNTGLIRGGDGADGDGSIPLNGGDGGGVTVRGQIIANDGQILGGNGGNVPPPSGTANGGAGGNVIVFAGPEEPGMLINRGEIRAGDGGSGFNGGNGGDLAMLATSLLVIDGGIQSGGRGGAGDLDNGGSNGNDGATTIAGAMIWNNGEITRAGTDFAFAVLGPASRFLPAGSRLVIPYVFLNRSLSNDGYSLIWTNSANWKLDGLPGAVNVAGLRFGLLLVDSRLPQELTTGDETILRLSARSRGNPSLAVNRAVRLRITGATVLHLPQIARNGRFEPVPLLPTLPGGPPAGGLEPQLYIAAIWR